jgi:CGNR zinc finger
VATRIAIMPLDEVVRLVNEWGTLPRELDGRASDPGVPHDPELTALADQLHPIFAADGERANTDAQRANTDAERANTDAERASTDAERARRVTALLEQSRVRPILQTAGDGQLVEAWLVDDPAQADRAAAALALREQLAQRPGRIGVCADRQCADVYVDLSPAGRRRFCCLTCQNRARAESFRKRRAGPDRAGRPADGPA